ncbi:response regulator [Roseateles toxinivorans]|uniref:Winged helix family two component transcriptional regulator n=1 Tax=Roseateles toxinivorans TaxID=270368 RepID=A0A4R6QGQ0_9BURK|nr:response regulator transcription factor [Roseateles toxinivorans]TDP61807.1 winged helix family two component transcriptional regulator [Roseateles toxinivorans]
MRLLLVEDDRMIGEGLRAALRLEGFAVDWVRDVAAAQTTLASERFDLVLLDLGLPPGGGAAANDPKADPTSDGLTVLRGMRARQDQTPVIVLTARDGAGERVKGLDSGADDYIVKPFELDELNARIRAVMRRHSGRGQALLSFGAVTLDPATRQVTLNGQPVVLSARELAVLEALLQRPGALLSRAQLEDRLYGWGEEIESNAVSVYIHQLRRKLGADFIQNVRGVGYYVGSAKAEGP